MTHPLKELELIEEELNRLLDKPIESQSRFMFRGLEHQRLNIISKIVKELWSLVLPLDMPPEK